MTTGESSSSYVVFSIYAVCTGRTNNFLLIFLLIGVLPTSVLLL